MSLGLLAAWTGVWSVVENLYCEKVRTLSTNWNLKFQRGKTEGPYPRVEMALGFFPPRLLFFVLISPWFLHHSPDGGGGETGDIGVVSTRGNEDARQPRVAGVWRTPLNLKVPGTGSFASQIPELPSSNMMVDPPAQCSSTLRFVLGLQEGGSTEGEALSSGVRLEIKSCCCDLYGLRQVTSTL